MRLQWTALIAACATRVCGAFPRGVARIVARSSVARGAVKLAPELEAEIGEYLATRERSLAAGIVMDARGDIARAAREEPFWRFTSYLFSLESFLPKALEDEDEASPLAYSELLKYGYVRLVEPIMDAGGHVEVSRVLGLTVVKVKPVKEPQGWTRPPEPEWRGIKAGAGIEDAIASRIGSINSTEIKLRIAERERLDTLSTVRQQPSEKALAIDAMMAKERRVRARQADVLVTIAKSRRTKWPTLLAPLSLEALARAYAILALFALAAPDSRSSAEIVDALVALDFASKVDLQTALTATKLLGYALGLLNLASVPAAVVLDRRSSRPYSAARALLGGPFALLEDLNLPVQPTDPAGEPAGELAPE